MVTWSSEAEMCSAFMVELRARGCRVFPEFVGWDMVVELPMGCLVGIEAKLRPNVKVLAQAVRGDAVDVHAVLVPRANQDFQVVAAHVQLLVLQTDSKYTNGTGAFLGARAAWLVREEPHFDEALLRRPRKRAELPPGEPLHAIAGAPAPLRITDWKLAAVKLCLLAEAQGGHILSTDFEAAKVDMKIWLRRGWLEFWAEEKRGRKKIRSYRLAAGNGVPHRAYPDIVDLLRPAPTAGTAGEQTGH
jgi:hypothetical protein